MSPGALTASSSSFFIRRSVFILPEPFPWKRWDSCRKACDRGSTTRGESRPRPAPRDPQQGGRQAAAGVTVSAQESGGGALPPGLGGDSGRKGPLVTKCESLTHGARGVVLFLSAPLLHRPASTCQVSGRGAGCQTLCELRGSVLGKPHGEFPS